MLIYNEKINKEDKIKISSIIEKISDIYKDFYITKNNLRLFIHDNVDLLFDCLNNGDKIVYGEEGILLVTGYSDSSKRKYLKILSENINDAIKLITLLIWNLESIDLYIKVKKYNPIIKALMENDFRFFAGRGKELLYLRKGKINK